MVWICTMMTEIANETARGQLEETQHKTKFRHLWAHTMCQGKKLSRLRKNPLINWLLLYQLHEIMHTKKNKNSITTTCAKKGNTKMSGVHTQTAIKLTAAKTMIVKLEHDSVYINGISVVHQVLHLVMVWCLFCQSHVEHWSLGSLDFPLTLHSL